MINGGLIAIFVLVQSNHIKSTIKS